MKTSLLVLLIPIIAEASESSLWDLDNNSVTYSDSISGVALGSDSQTFAMSQFNSADAAMAEGTAGDYTLTKVVISINASILGDVLIENPNAFDVNGVTVYMNSVENFVPGQGYSAISLGGLSARETYADGETFGTIVAGGEATHVVDNSGEGAGITELNASFDAFEGPGTIDASVDFVGTWSAQNLPNSVVTVDVNGEAEFSVTYFYDYTPVPEPSSAFLLGIGILFLSLRRKLGGKAFCTTKC